MTHRAPADVHTASTATLLAAAAIVGLLVARHVADAVPASVDRPVPTVASTAPAAPAPFTPAVPFRSTRPHPAPAAESPICGWDVDARGEDGPPGSTATVPEPVRARLSDALDTLMLSSPDPAVQAAALLIGARTRPDESRLRIERLARLATASRDARIYAIAAEACQDGLDDWASACHLVEPAQWAQLDPDDALPWLALAAASRSHGDLTAEDDAMYRASQARHSDLRPVVLPALVEQALAGTPPHSLLRTLGLATSGQVQAGWSFSSTAQAMHYCMADDRVLTDPDRASTCDRLAHVLADAGGGSTELAIAQSIGVRLDWPAERLSALTRQADASAAIARRQNVAMDMSCRGVDEVEAALRATMAN